MKTLEKTIFSEKYRHLIADIVVLRHKRRMTQRDLAKKLGVPQVFIARTELFERRMDVAEYAAIMKALDVPKKDALRLLGQVF